MTKPPIAAILEHYGWDGRLSGRGPWYRVNCPFHGDRHASASLNEDEQVFVCHACEIRGDAFALVMMTDGCDFIAAREKVREITGHAGLSIGSVSGDSGRQYSSKLPLWTRERHGSTRRPGRRLSGNNSRERH